MIPMTEEQCVIFAAAAKRCATLAVPFKHHGRWDCPGLRGSKTGLDCVGLGLHCAIKAGRLVSTLLDPRAYRRVPVGNSLTQYLEAKCGKTIGDKDEDLRLGAVAVFSSGPDPSHIAIVADGKPGKWMMAHADQYFGKTVLQPYSGNWGASRLTGIYLP